MLKLLIIADDFTGALDTGVQFAACGAVTRVVTDYRYEMSRLHKEVQVLVVDAETRHLDARAAYDVVYSVVKQACKLSIPYIYKKTDSGLRGNIGSELAAVLAASGEKLIHFLPAFPQMERNTVDGIHYIEGIPVHESVFGQDPFEPVLCSEVGEIIRQQTDVPVIKIREQDAPEDASKPSIVLYDADRQERLLKAGRQICRGKGVRLLAGCAGFAAVLPRILNLEHKSPVRPAFHKPLLVICGSVNPITVGQLNYAEDHGFLRIRLEPEQKLDCEYYETMRGKADLMEWKKIFMSNPRCILDTNDGEAMEGTAAAAVRMGLGRDQIRKQIARTLGRITKELIDSGLKSTYLITGGDTLIGFLEQAGAREITPICELEAGVVLSQFRMGNRTLEVISKSGGFGGETMITDLAEKIQESKEIMLC